jgi:DNA-binding GntR family transcriptional regulator
VTEHSLSELTGIGRTPVREAIQRLAREHLVLVLPQRGVVVSEINVAKQLRLLETRREVERLICRSAARKASDLDRKTFQALAQQFVDSADRADDTGFMQADREFNELLLKAAQNEFAEGAMRLLQGLSRRFWFLHHDRAGDIKEIARLHAAVAMAVAAGEIEAAGDSNDLLLDHLERIARATVAEY